MPVPRFLLATALGGVGLHALPPEGEAILGRGPDCEVALDFAQISRQHARLRIGETCVLTDLGSRNGTLLRGERLCRWHIASCTGGQGQARFSGYRIRDLTTTAPTHQSTASTSSRLE